MAHHSISATHPNDINVVEDCDTNLGFLNCYKVGAFISSKDGGLDKSYPIAISESYDSVVGYQEGKGQS